MSAFFRSLSESIQSEQNRQDRDKIASNQDEKVGTFILSRDFRILMLVGRINAAVGWFLVIGLVLGAIVFVENTKGYSLIALFLIPFALLVVASGQGISCFVSTERNTKDTHGVLKQILDKMEDKPNQQEEVKEEQ